MKVEIRNEGGQPLGTINAESLKHISQSEATSRVLDGSEDHGYAEEWTSEAYLSDGRLVTVIWMFDDADTKDDDGNPLEIDSYPWDDNHIRRVVLSEEDFDQAPWVKAIRARLGLTQAALAEKCGVSPRTVENWEQGRTRISGSARKILEGL